MLALIFIMAGAFVSYFYHGIYLGPRYLFETLPGLLILTARGIFTLGMYSQEMVHELYKWASSKTHIAMLSTRAYRSVATIILVGACLLCNLLYFMPRQIELHNNYTGLPAGWQMNLAVVYHPPMHHAIIVTDNQAVYQFVLFPLNDPLLHDDVIYAWASSQADYTELHTAFPGRALYRLDIMPDGSVQYESLTG